METGHSGSDGDGGVLQGGRTIGSEVRAATGCVAEQRRPCSTRASTGIFGEQSIALQSAPREATPRTEPQSRPPSSTVCALKS